MSKFQVSFETQDDVDGDLDSFESGVHQVDGNGVLGDDDEFSIARSLSGTPTGLSAKQKAAQQERSTLGAKETRVIFCLRLVVLLTLVMIGVSFALALFYHTNAAQEQEFEDQFGFYRDQVFEKFNRNLERKLNAMDSLSTDITSYAKASGSEFPFVTVPDFEFRGANARISGDAAFIFYMPYITEGMRAPWEAYAAANRATYSVALDSELASKATQDASYGLTTPEIDGMGRETLDFMEAIQAGVFPAPFNTSEIWSFNVDVQNVSTGNPVQLQSST